MYIPTFYFLKDNYPEEQLETITRNLKNCGARVVIIDKGKSNDSLAKDFASVIANHI